MANKLMNITMNILNIRKCVVLAAVSALAAGNLRAQDYSVYDGEEVLEKVETNSTSAVSKVSGESLYKTPASNFTNTLIGIPGLTVMQGTGSYEDNKAKWLVRGIGSYAVSDWNTAKIFVDGFEVNSEYLTGLSASEVESVEVLKDGAALALYGERGANGVIRITTKRGRIGNSTVTARMRYGVQTPDITNKPLGSYDFANLYNQAVSNDNGMVWSPAYSEDQLSAYRNGTAPDVDWYDAALKGFGQYADGGIVLNGGARNARYNVNLDYLNNSGILNTSNTDQTKNLGYQKFNLRANLDFNILKIFEVKVDFGGRIEMLKRPNYGVAQLFNDIATYPSNIYNVYDDADESHYSGTALYPNNPYASVNGLGWMSYKSRSLQGNFSVKERLDDITKGLYLQESISFYSYTLSQYGKTKNYARWNEGVTTTTDETTTITATGYGSNGMQDWKQGVVTAGYDRVSGRSTVSAAVNFHLSAYKGDGYFSYKYNTMNLNGFAHYEYDNRYIAELGFSYFGNDAYAPGHRWAAYPAGSVAWIVSNENFLKGDDVLNFFKLRASAGLSGASDSGATSVLSGYSSNGRYLFKDYYTYSYVGSFYTGKTSGVWQNSLVPMFIKNEDAHAEKSMKYNLGFDATIARNLNITADFFLDKRTDILTLDNSLMGYYGKQFLFTNSGSMTNKGFEVAAGWSGKSGDFEYALNGQVTFSRNRIDNMNEVAPANAFSAQTGRPVGTYIGLVADGFYGIEDFNEDGTLLADLPVPAFGSVQPGDVKYLDLDRNGVVDQNDVTRIGRSAYPEWYFSFGGRFGYKGFDMQVLFQGVAGVSANLLDNWNQMVAFVDNGNAYNVAKGAWAYFPTEGIDNRANATYPRLTTQSNENNYRTSSLWIKDASFLKLRNIEIGYNFASGKVKKSGISNLRVYLSGHNLFTVSPLLKDYDLDPENLKGLYPVMRTWTAGVAITF